MAGRAAARVAAKVAAGVAARVAAKVAAVALAILLLAGLALPDLSSWARTEEQTPSGLAGLGAKHQSYRDLCCT